MFTIRVSEFSDGPRFCSCGRELIRYGFTPSHRDDRTIGCDVETVVAIEIRTWADGFGLWHASVPAELPNAHDKARAAILGELVARDDIGPGYVVRIVEVESDSANRKVFRETFAPDQP